MEPILTTLLATALFEVAKKLAEEGIVKPALASGLEPFQKWLTSGYDSRKASADLQKVFVEAIKKIGAPSGKEELANWAETVGLARLQAPKNELLRRQVALAVVEYVDEDSAPSDDLLFALRWPNDKAKDLSVLLKHLRVGLASLPSWKPLLDYADNAHQRGLLKKMAADINRFSNAVISSPAGEALKVYIVGQMKLTEEQACEIDRGYRSLVEEEYRMHIVTGLAQVQKAVRLPLKDIYLELGLIPFGVRKEEQEEIVELMKADDSVRLNRKMQEAQKRVANLIAEERHLVIMGKPGSGKTISLKYIALMLAMGSTSAARLGLDAPYLPVYIRLTNYAQALQARPSLSLEAYLNRHFEDRYPGVDQHREFLQAALQKGACMVLLDGLDEVGDFGDQLLKGKTLRENVLREVQRFTEQRCGGNCGNRVIVTSRLEGYHRGDLADFVETELSELRYPDEVEAFLRRWYAAYIHGSDPKLSLETAEAHALRERVGPLMASITQSDSVKLLAMNPLLLTILAVIYETHNTPLPNRRAELYQIVAKTLAQNWRRYQTGQESRIYQSNIGASDIFYMMASLAYWLHEKNPEGTMPLDDWKEKIADLMKDFGEEKEIRGLVDEFVHHASEETGLLTERSQGQIGFFHLTLEEYFAAVEIARQDTVKQLKVLEEHWQNPRWQEVLLLTAGELEQRGNRLALEAYLNAFLGLEPADPAQRGRNVFLAGRALADIGPRSVGQAAQRATRRVLKVVAQDLDADAETPNPKANYSIQMRAFTADTLDELGWPLDGLYDFLPVGKGKEAFHLAKYPVINLQYERFLKSGEFAEKTFWLDFPKFDEKGQPMGETWGDAGWDWLQRALKDEDDKVIYPREWRNPRFGIARKTAPVIAITWWEANAYCKWLSKNWGELEESRNNSALHPKTLRLPIEREWVLAAGGEKPEGRYPWDEKGKITKEVEEILRRANVGESGINRTTPVGMYPLGASPFGLLDMAGNVWEWQANFSSNNRQFLALRGGSWRYDHDYARVAGRNYDRPVDDWNFYGFRVAFPPI